MWAAVAVALVAISVVWPSSRFLGGRALRLGLRRPIGTRVSFHAPGPRPDQGARIGRRVALPLTSGVLLMPGGRWRKRLARIPVRIDNVSVSGIGWIGPASLDIRAGSTIWMEIDGDVTPVRVRRVTDPAVGGVKYFAAEFAHPTLALVPAVERLLAAHPPDR